MKSRYVLTEKPVEPHEVAPLRAEGLLIDNKGGEVLKAKGGDEGLLPFSNAEDLESTTPPQVAKDTVFFVLQILARMQFLIGHLDFTQAFHSGHGIDRELYCFLLLEGVPGLHERQVLRLLKTCYRVLLTDHTSGTVPTCQPSTGLSRLCKEQGRPMSFPLVQQGPDRDQRHHRVGHG